jgi:hypothetical protein
MAVSAGRQRRQRRSAAASHAARAGLSDDCLGAGRTTTCVLRQPRLHADRRLPPLARALRRARGTRGSAGRAGIEPRARDADLGVLELPHLESQSLQRGQSGHRCRGCGQHQLDDRRGQLSQLGRAFLDLPAGDVDARCRAYAAWRRAPVGRRRGGAGHRPPRIAQRRCVSDAAARGHDERRAGRSEFDLHPERGRARGRRGRAAVQDGAVALQFKYRLGR